MKRLLLLFMLLSTCYAGAQTISTEAPSQTASAVTVGPKTFQIESRIQQTRSGGAFYYNLPYNLFRLGLGSRAELRVTNGLNITKFDNSTATYLSNISLGGKVSILNRTDGKTQIGLIANVDLPVYYKYKYFGTTWTLAFNHPFKNNQAISYNVNYRYYSNFDIQETVTTISASLVYSNMITRRLGVFGEVYGYGAQSYYEFAGKTWSDALNFDMGFLFLITNNIQLDYSFGYSVTDDERFHAIGFNIMFRDRNDRIWK